MAIIVVRPVSTALGPDADRGGVRSVMLSTHSSYSQSPLFALGAVMSPTGKLSAAHRDVMTAGWTLRLNADHPFARGFQGVFKGSEPLNARSLSSRGHKISRALTP